MLPIVLATTLTCRDVFSIVNRIQLVLKLSPQQKIEIVKELKKVIPSCPITIKESNHAFK